MQRSRREAPGLRFADGNGGQSADHTSVSIFFVGVGSRNAEAANHPKLVIFVRAPMVSDTKLPFCWGGGNNPVTLNDQILIRNQPMSLSIGSEVGKLFTLIAG